MRQPGGRFSISFIKSTLNFIGRIFVAFQELTQKLSVKFFIPFKSAMFVMFDFPKGLFFSRYSLPDRIPWRLRWPTTSRPSYSLPDKDFGLRYQSESSTTYQYVRLTRIPSGLAKIII